MDANEILKCRQCKRADAMLCYLSGCGHHLDLDEGRREPDLAPPTKLDLRDLCRDKRGLITEISTYKNSWERETQPWMLLGEVQITREDRNHHYGSRWDVKAYLANAVDPEHDSAQILRLGLIGVEFIEFRYGVMEIEGWVNPVDAGGFRVPVPGYNPLGFKDTEPCRAKECRGGEPHVIVPSGYYVPRHDPATFALMRGRQVHIYSTRAEGFGDNYLKSRGWTEEVGHGR